MNRIGDKNKSSLPMSTNVQFGLGEAVVHDTAVVATHSQVLGGSLYL
ncbi:MAG: hypothetical protein KDE48_24010 [Anaerolineales bacterium]|nr:hypothetical protein [Anaerolineales bacterium]